MKLLDETKIKFFFIENTSKEEVIDEAKNEQIELFIIVPEGIKEFENKNNIKSFDAFLESLNFKFLPDDGKEKKYGLFTKRYKRM